MALNSPRVQLQVFYVLTCEFSRSRAIYFFSQQILSWGEEMELSTRIPSTFFFFSSRDLWNVRKLASSEAWSVDCDKRRSHDFPVAFGPTTEMNATCSSLVMYSTELGRETAGATQKPVRNRLVLLADLSPVAAPSAHPLVVNTHRS